MGEKNCKKLLYAPDNSHDNCCKIGMFALVAKLLRWPYELAQTVHPALPSNTLSVIVYL